MNSVPIAFSGLRIDEGSPGGAVHSGTCIYCVLWQMNQLVHYAYYER